MDTCASLPAWRNRFTTATRSPEAHGRRTSPYPGGYARLASLAVSPRGVTSTPRLSVHLAAAEADGPSAPALRSRPSGTASQITRRG